MKRVDGDEFRDEPSGYLDRAKSETVIITENGEPSLVVLSWEVFSQLRRGNRQALKVDELSEDDINAIAEARMPSEDDYLNAELDDDARNYVARYEYFLLGSAVPIRVAYDRIGLKMSADVPDRESGALVKRASYLSVVERSPDVEEITQQEFEQRCAGILKP